MDIPIQSCDMVEVMRRGFDEPHKMRVPISENQLATGQIIEEVSEHVWMNYAEIPDSRYVAQLVDDFLFPWDQPNIPSLLMKMRASQEKWRLKTLLHNNHHQWNIVQLYIL